MPKRYDYFDHKADVGIIGIGRTLPGAFEQAAKAMFNLMYDVEKVKPLEEIQIECEADNSEELFVEWLNALLAQANIHELGLGEFQVKQIKGSQLLGCAKGEPLDPQRHNLKTEVKAATYAMLKVEREDEKYIAQCVVDV
jgi:SHS2 domain-containing protein